MQDEINIVPTTDGLIGGLWAVLDAVARERRYIGFLEAPPVDAVRAFLRQMLADGGVQFLGLGAAGVVGWCDIARNPLEGFRHVGRLGMGLLPEFRGRGLGRRLALRTIEAARQEGVERIELEVFASNITAIALYERLGFVTEGVRRRSRKLDGKYDDNVMMALVDQPRHD